MQLFGTQKLQTADCPTVAFDQNTARFLLYFAAAFTAVFFVERGVRAVLLKRQIARRRYEKRNE